MSLYGLWVVLNPATGHYGSIASVCQSNAAADGCAVVSHPQHPHTPQSPPLRLKALSPPLRPPTSACPEGTQLLNSFGLQTDSMGVVRCSAAGGGSGLGRCFSGRRPLGRCLSGKAAKFAACSGGLNGRCRLIPSASFGVVVSSVSVQVFLSLWWLCGLRIASWSGCPSRAPYQKSPIPSRRKSRLPSPTRRAFITKAKCKIDKKRIANSTLQTSYSS